MAQIETEDIKVVLTWKSPHRYKRNKRTFYLPDNVEDVAAEIHYYVKELRSEKIELIPHHDSPTQTKIVRKR